MKKKQISKEEEEKHNEHGQRTGTPPVDKPFRMSFPGNF